MIEKEKFERHLRGTNLSENTISSYLFAIKQYGEQYDDVTQKKLRAYKVWLIENYKPKTVNLRLRAINCYLECIGKEKWKLPFVRVQQKTFLENVISEADYKYFKSCLKNDDEMFWYFVIRFLAATGARVSELIQIKAEHVKLGHLDLYSKGGKLRRIYIPKELQNEALSWLAEKQQESGFFFVNVHFLYNHIPYHQKESVFAVFFYFIQDILTLDKSAVFRESPKCIAKFILSITKLAL